MPADAGTEAANQRTCDLMAVSPRRVELELRQSFVSLLEENTACIARQDAQCSDQLLAQVDTTSLLDNEAALFTVQRAEVANLRGDREGAWKLFQEATDRAGGDGEVKTVIAQRYASWLLTQGEFSATLRVLAAAFDCDTWTANALTVRAAAYQRIFAFALAMENVDAAIRLYEMPGRAVPAAVMTMRGQIAEELAKPTATTVPGRSSHPDLVPVVRGNPAYPSRALQRGISGCAKIEFSLSEHGVVENARAIESTNELFEEPSIAAVQLWRYVPRMEGGLPVRVEGIETTISFELQGARLPANCPPARL